jgi:5-oxopent-3-ene-1,2,5-tricarboxylate decarboxylase/2-hydroxyhepta-2,4-diene-1,7-dioate isomerase
MAMSKAWARFRGLGLTEELEVFPGQSEVLWNGKRYHTEKLPWEAPAGGTVYGVLLNYRGALAALGDAVYQAPYGEPPKAPILYIKPRNTVIGCGMPIPLPEKVEELEVGATLGVVIGQTATRVSEAEALAYVQGYTVVNDVSIPHHSFYRPAVKERARDGFCPMGPWVVERSAVPCPDSLAIRVFVNGQLRQENTTAHLVRPVAQLLADVTEFMTLYPGDTLLVGVPEAAPRVRAGDWVRIDIEGVGVLHNRVVPENHVNAGDCDETGACGVRR